MYSSRAERALIQASYYLSVFATDPYPLEDGSMGYRLVHAIDPVSTGTDEVLMIAALVLDVAEEMVLNDAARVALDLAANYSVDADFLRTTSAGKALIDAGLGDDLSLCASVDRHDLVPEMRERRITLPPPEDQG